MARALGGCGGCCEVGYEASYAAGTSLRVRTCKLGLRELEEEAAWIEGIAGWAARFDDLDNVIEELKRKGKVDGRKKRK